MSTFQSNPKRDAYATIKGFLYQIQLTIDRWLNLNPDEVLYCECGEDIDKVKQLMTNSNNKAAEERILEQIKALDHNLTLRSAEILTSLARYREHIVKNRSIRLIYWFSTTASPGKERTQNQVSINFPRNLSGIEAWQVMQGTTNPPFNPQEEAIFIQELKKLISTASCPRDFDQDVFLEFKKYIEINPTNTLINDFIKNFYFTTNLETPQALDERIQQLLISQNRANSSTEAEKLTDTLISYILRFISKKGDKKLVYKDLDTILEKKVPYQIPQDIQDFVGRERELPNIVGELEKIKEPNNTALIIVAIGGMVGSGKSCLAIHAAHLKKDLFADGQVYINLRRSDGKYLESSDVIKSFLKAFRVSERLVQQNQPDLVKFYRSFFSDKQTLFLLDNARDEAQVRDLLPNSSTCAVIITSQKYLSLEGSTNILLEEMPEPEALLLFKKIVGIQRVGNEEGDANTIINLCGYLPLAIRIAGSKLRSRRNWTLGYYAQQLSNEQQRLRCLSSGDLEIRSTFLLSYKDLSNKRKRLFRLLSLMPGRRIAVEVAHYLLEIPLDKAEKHMEYLLNVHLLQPLDEKSYCFHSLLKLFSKEKLEKKEKPEIIKIKSLTLANKFLDKAFYFNPFLDPASSKAKAEEIASQHSVEISKVQYNLFLYALEDWFEKEKENLIAFIEYTAQEDIDTCWHLAVALVPFFMIRNYYNDWEQTHKIALKAISESNNLLAKAHLLSNLGTLYALQDDVVAARESYGESLKSCNELTSSPRVRSDVLRDLFSQNYSNLANIYYKQESIPEFFQMAKRALKLAYERNDPSARGEIFNNTALYYYDRKNWRKAESRYRKSLKIFNGLNDYYRAGNVLCNLATIYSNTNKIPKALESYNEALSIATQVKDFHFASYVLNNIGKVHLDENQIDKAIKPLSESWELKAEIGDILGAISTLSSLREAFEKKGSLGEIIQPYRKIYLLNQKSKDKKKNERSIEILTNLAETYCKLASWQEAHNTYKNLLEFFREPQDNQGFARCLKNIAATAFHNNELEISFYYYEQGVTFSKSIHDNSLQLDFLTALIQGYMHTKQNLDRVPSLEDEANNLTASIQENKNK